MGSIWEKSHGFYVQHSPSAGVLPFSLIGKLGLGWLFSLIFWGRGLLPWFPNVFARGGIAPPLPVRGK